MTTLMASGVNVVKLTDAWSEDCRAALQSCVYMVYCFNGQYWKKTAL